MNSDEFSVDYIFVTDLNGGRTEDSKIDEIVDQHKQLDSDSVVIVTPEIEAWYLAGIDEEAAKQLKIRNLRDTNSLTKEQFDSMKPKSASSMRDFMAQILPYYSIETAKRKNRSFAIFAERYGL